MRLENNNIKLETNNHGEVTSIKFKGQEILHDGSQWWAKTYPMIWPNISFSNGFIVNGKNYELPKHGFWKDLAWDAAYEGESLTLFATHFANERYPFTIDIQHNISLEENEIKIATTFSNLSKDEAYFHFGHHPAFLIDKDSVVKVPNNRKPQQLDLQGKLRKEEVELTKLVDMDFGIKYDTLVFKDVDFDSVAFKSNGLNISISSSDFNSLQIWKPKDAMFVCVEPWQGWNDNEYEAPKDASEKIEIISLASGDVITKEITIGIKK